jgi:flavodoxin
MTVFIIYGLQFGNTERIARAIATPLDPSQVVRAQGAGTSDLTACDPLVIGGRTQRHGVSPALREVFERIPRGALAQVPTAALDTATGWAHS